MAQRSYTSAFKVNIVLEVLREAKTPEEIASENNLNPNMVRAWKKEFIEKAAGVFDKDDKQEREMKRKEAIPEKKNTKMLKTIGQLTIERDFLQDCFRECGYPIPTLDTYGKD